MRRHIPSLRMLQAFESASRLQSFTQAADELHVTQSAISRHIRALEAELGISLFHRLGHRVVLAPVAAEYVGVIQNCLDEIEAATFAIKTRERESQAFHLVTPPTFGARWLVPRLPAFMSRYPAVDVRLSVRAERIDFNDLVFDAAIGNGPPPPSNVDFEKLTEGDFVPVCSPQLLRGRSASLDISDIGRFRLLELGNDRPWDALNARYAISGYDAAAVRRFEYFDAGIQSAVAGGGILLVPPFLVQEQLTSGSLAVAFRQRVSVPSIYYCCYSRRAARSKPVKLFCSWLRREMVSTLDACDSVLSNLVGPMPSLAVGEQG